MSTNVWSLFPSKLYIALILCLIHQPINLNTGNLGIITGSRCTTRIQTSKPYGSQMDSSALFSIQSSLGLDYFAARNVHCNIHGKFFSSKNYNYHKIKYLIKLFYFSPMSLHFFLMSRISSNHQIKKKCHLVTIQLW